MLSGIEIDHGERIFGKRALNPTSR
jgi:hypothetical protein